MSRYIFLAAVLACSSAVAQTWPDYHLTNGTHNSSYGVELYEPGDPVKNLYIDPVAVLQAGATELDDIYDGNQVYLSGGTIFASAIDESDFTWTGGDLHLDGGTHTTTYGLSSGAGKSLYIDSSAVVEYLSPVIISTGNNLNLNDGGKLTVGDFDTSLTGFSWNEGGALEIRGILSSTASDLYFMERQHLILQGAAARYTGALSLESESMLSILDGAILESTSLDTYYWGDGHIEVSGTGSEFRAGYLGLGEDGQSSTGLIVSDGGKVFSGGARLGDNGGSGNIATVSGAGSEWSASGGIIIGSAIGGEHNRLIVTNGGMVYSSYGIIGGYDRGTAYNTVEIKDVGSQWNITGSLLLGDAGVGNSLSIEGGGVVTSESAIIGRDGYDYTANNNEVSVSGEGSKWINSGDLEISADINSRTRFRGNSLTITNGGEVVIGGVVTINNETSYTTGNEINLDNGGRLTIQTDFNASMPGFNYNAGSTLAVEGELTGLSTLEIDRRLEAATVLGGLMVQGTYAPGSSPADSILDGGLTMGSDGVLEMEIGGTAVGNMYDRLTVTGSADLDGTLELVLLDEYSPGYGDVFDLFNWDGGVTGEFASTNAPALAGGLYWDLSGLYTTGTVTVVPEPSSAVLMIIFGGLGYVVRRYFPSL